MEKITLIVTAFLMSNVCLSAGGGTGTIADLKYNSINFVILVSVLIWKLKKPLKEMFDKNAEEVTSLYALAEEKDKEATIRINELKSKMSRLENEKENILNEARSNAEAFSSEHKRETDGLITNLESDTKSKIENEKKQMVHGLNEALIDEVITKVKVKISNDNGLQGKASEKLMAQI